MRKLFVALLLLVVGGGAASQANLALASIGDDTQVGDKLVNGQIVSELRTRAAKLRTSAGNPGDTTFVGFTPGKQNNPAFPTPNNYWSVYAGFSPGGSNSPAYHRPPAEGGMWGWQAPVNGDSLQGWWSLRLLYTEFRLPTGGSGDDYLRPFGAVDEGNNANYVSLGAGSGSSKRTFGVVGVWHRDSGNGPAGTANGVTWAPLGGSYSAWMGLRRHGDNQYVDAITNNPFNDDCMMFNKPQATAIGGNDRKFPGYGDQMDQMLYRDIDGSAHSGENLTISFKYRTNMSTGFGTATTTRLGWFDKDPLQATPTHNSENNYISSTLAGSNAARDSFMVYIGAPVGTSFKASTGATISVFDTQRRWFDEVIKSTDAKDSFWRELESVAGNVAPVTKTVTLSSAQLGPLLSNGANKLRLVFRVKTGRAFSDEDSFASGFSSGGAGAAVVDDVTYSWSGGGGVVNFGDFESPTAINNDTGVLPTDAWKSTGKPPAIIDHLQNVSDLPYADLCGAVGNASRQCNLVGGVIVNGNKDLGNAAQGLDDGTAERNLMDGIISPTIQFVGPYTDGGKNVMGLYGPGLNPGADHGQGDIIATEDMYIDYDLYAGIYDLQRKGQAWTFAIQCYPTSDQNGNAEWGQLQYPGFQIFNPDQQCFEDIESFVGNGLIRTSNASGIPDSVKILVRKNSQCFRFGLTTTCAPTDGSYFDNISLALIDGETQTIGEDIWQFINDAFSVNEVVDPNVAAQFDTTVAVLRTGLNTAPGSDLLRFDVPGDSTEVFSAGQNVRLDLVFRILPGPGNYGTLGRPDLSNLRKVANNAAQVTAGDLTNFWSNYMADNGAFGTGGNGVTGPGHPVAASGPLAGQKVWDPNRWNSARCDSAEGNLFPFQGRGVNGTPAVSQWMSTYHELDGKGVGSYDPQGLGRPPQLGVERKKCFIRTESAGLQDIDCVNVPAYITAGAPGVPAAPANGYDGHQFSPEGTKIIPDGLLTPGSHVEYFFRRSVATTGAFVQNAPDTGRVFPQLAEGNTDCHRWQEFSILPDKWKSPNYKHPVTGEFGLGPACLLVVDNNDRRGNERAWVGIADTIGATAIGRFGAHNGWHAIGNKDEFSFAHSINNPANNRIPIDNNPAHDRIGFVAEHRGHPGTIWDMFQVKASESITTSAGSLGSRLAHHDPTNTQINGKASTQGPTPAMLDAFYNVMFWMTGDLNSGDLGPFPSRSQDDVSIITTWLNHGTSSSPGNRAFWAMGDGFTEDNISSGGSQADLMTNYFGVNLRDPDYNALAQDLAHSVLDITPFSAITTQPDVYGLRNNCFWTNDVLERTSGLIGQTEDATKYPDRGAGPFPMLSGVAKRFNATQHWISLIDGWDIEHLTSRFDNDTRGRSRYFLEAMTNLFAAFFGASSCGQLGSSTIPLDVPNVGGDVMADYARLYGNPMTTGTAVFSFGLAKDDNVEIKVYDVGGRLVRTLADQRFKAGEHRLTWDGLGNDGRKAARGVYFARVRYKSSLFTAANKIIVLH